MNKFSCTRSLGEDIFYATLIAENEQQAREMAAARGNGVSGFSRREWMDRRGFSIAATARRSSVGANALERGGR